MDKLDRIYELHGLLRSRRRPLSMQGIKEALGCSHSTAKRTIEALRDHFFAPLEYDRKANGWYYDQHGEHPFELPGLWFNASELHALIVVQQLLDEVQPGLLDDKLSPLRRRIEEILGDKRLAADDVARRVHVQRLASRQVVGRLFQDVASALMTRRRLYLRYHGRGDDRESERDVSPQRLLHYRDNWYLIAWCHRRDDLRSFSLDRIRAVHPLDLVAVDVDEARLEVHGAAYGIFGGAPCHTARLHFTPEAARWVADEKWHPDQQGSLLPDGGYEMHVPYADHRELVMDILRWGADAEVLEPPELRREIARRLRLAHQRYE